MNKTVKKQWLKALRSGEYKQGQSQLRQVEEGDYGEEGEVKFCCLGVLCDIYGKKNNISFKKQTMFLGQDAFLPKKVRQWAGLVAVDPGIPKGNYKGITLSALNDGNESLSEPLSFKRIANLIEKYL